MHAIKELINAPPPESIQDLERKSVVADLNKTSAGSDFFGGDENPQNKDPIPISIAWSADGTTIYAGYTDNVIRVWEI